MNSLIAHGGFSVHNQVRAAGEDREGRMKLAGHMIRAPVSLAKMRHDAATGTVIYHSKIDLPGESRHSLETAPGEPLGFLGPF